MEANYLADAQYNGQNSVGTGLDDKKYIFMGAAQSNNFDGKGHIKAQVVISGTGTNSLASKILWRLAKYDNSGNLTVASGSSSYATYDANSQVVSVTVAPKDKVSAGFSVHKNGETETLTFTPKSGNHFAEKPPLLEGIGDSMLWQYDAQSSSSDQKVLKVAAATSDKSLALKATVYFKVTSGGGGGGSNSPLPNAKGYAHQVQIIAHQPGTLAASGSAVQHPDKDASYDYFALIRQNTDNDVA